MSIVIHESPASNNPADRTTERDIIDAMARALFIHAWSAYMLENHAKVFAGCATAPVDTDAAAYHGAQTLVYDLIRANGDTLASLWTRCQSDDLDDCEQWGKRVALQYIGTDIMWNEYGGNPDADFNVPSGEFGSHSLQNDYDADGNPVAV